MGRPYRARSGLPIIPARMTAPVRFDGLCRARCFAGAISANLRADAPSRAPRILRSERPPALAPAAPLHGRRIRDPPQSFIFTIIESQYLSAHASDAAAGGGAGGNTTAAHGEEGPAMAGESQSDLLQLVDR